MDEFYEQLENTINEIPRKDLQILRGDWNAQVGPDAYEQWSGTVGRVEWDKPTKEEKDFHNLHTGTK